VSAIIRASKMTQETTNTHESDNTRVSDNTHNEKHGLDWLKIQNT
jgi:hypothetical protein